MRKIFYPFILFFFWNFGLVEKSNSFLFVNFLNKYHHLLQPMVKGPLPPSPPMHVLDIGCGDGKSTHRIKYNLSKKMKVMGIDKDPYLIDQAVDNYPDCTFQKDDIRDSSLPSDRFDLIFLINVLHEIHPRDIQSVLKEIRRVSKPDSILYLDHFDTNPKNEYLNLNLQSIGDSFNVQRSVSTKDSVSLIVKV